MMYETLNPPAGRDLPPGRADAMRERIMRDIATPVRHRPRHRRTLTLAVGGLAAAAVLGGVLTGTGPRGGGSYVLAFGPGELSASLREASAWCLERHDRKASDARVADDDLAVAAEAGDTAALLYFRDGHYLACQVRRPAFGEVSGALATDGGGSPWRYEWLPGPVDRLLLTSTEADGGNVAVVGRVSARVHRLVLHYGGHVAAARITNGAFGLITEDGKVREHDDPQLVSYDATGAEIDRRPLFASRRDLTWCYADPGGNVVYGPPGPVCRPAERWTR
jgi:hypothetical protein